MAGCSSPGENHSAQLPVKFESDFNADYGNLRLGGHIARHETGIYTVTITSPESLAGVRLDYVGGKITASLNGISFEAQTDNLPAAGFIKNVTSAIDTACGSPTVTVTKADGFNRYCVMDSCIILQEQQSGHITSLTIESIDISMNFINFETQ